MTRTFIQTKEFLKNWDRLGFGDDDLRKLELELLFHSGKYPIIKGSGGLRRAKIALNDIGKYEGNNDCYVHFAAEEIIYLITVCSENEKMNLSMEERNEINKRIKLLKANR